jgi:hypothetical protein
MEIKRILFDGLDAFELTTAMARMVVVTGLGPRIAFLGKPGGDNLFYWQNDELGYGEWRLKGGHRVWVSRPGADEAEDAYAADNGSCEVVQRSDGIEVTGQLHPLFKTRRGVHIRILDDATFQVTSFLTNCGPFLYSGGVWAATAIDPQGGKEFGIPLGDRSLSWDLIKVVIPRKFASHTSLVNDPQITYTEDFMIIRPQGIETKRAVMAPLGIIGMTWPAKGLSFLKHSPYDPNGRYPLGCNLAIYNGPNNFMFEMETFSLEQTVLPGSTIENRETWKLVDTILDWSDPEILKGQFAGI